MGIQERASDVYAHAQGLSDRIVSRNTREQFWAHISSFTNEQPFLASFLFIQLLLSFTPIALFASFTIGTILFSFITALLFSLFWIGAALLVLVPTLFVTVSLGIAVWLWVVSSFLVTRWAYNMIPLSVRGGMEVEMPNGKTAVINKTGDGFGDVEAKVKPQVPAKNFVVQPETLDVKEY